MITQWAWGVFLAVMLLAFGAFFGAVGMAVQTSPLPFLDTIEKLAEVLGATILFVGAFVALWPVYEGRQARAEEAASAMIGLRGEAVARTRHIVMVYAKFRHRLRFDVLSYYQMNLTAFLYETKPALEYGKAFVSRAWAGIEKAPSASRPGIASLLHQLERILGGLEFNIPLVDGYMNVAPEHRKAESESIAETMDMDLHIIESELPIELRGDFRLWCEEAEKNTDRIDLTFFADARGPLVISDQTTAAA